MLLDRGKWYKPKGNAGKETHTVHSWSAVSYFKALIGKPKERLPTATIKTGEDLRDRLFGPPTADPADANDPDYVVSSEPESD